MRFEATALHYWAEKIRNKLVDQAIHELINETQFNLSGDDSCLKNAWEEICAQVQIEESVLWSSYTDHIESIFLTMLAAMPRVEVETLWAISDSGWDWLYDHHAKDVDKLSDEDTPIIILEDLAVELQESLIQVAADYESETLERYKYSEFYEDEDEDEDEETTSEITIDSHTKIYYWQPQTVADNLKALLAIKTNTMPMTQEKNRTLMEIKIQKLLQEAGEEAQDIMMMSAEHLPEMYQIALSLNPADYVAGIMASDLMNEKMHKIIWPLEITELQESQQDEIQEILEEQSLASLLENL